VIVVHDVGPLVAPAYYTRPKRLRYETFLPWTCRLASAVVCVSHTTLVGLHAATGIDPGRCAVIGEGPQLLDIASGAAANGDPYLLYVGSLEERKNVSTLVEAVADADPARVAKLLIVGPLDGEGTARLTDRLGQAAGDHRVEHLGFVSPDRLSALYQGAVAVALPSLYEGFGLPVLEAMRSGTPVVASDIPAVREVAGDAALYVSRPFDASCWRDVLETVCTDSELRERLARRGVEAAPRFMWPEVGRAFSSLLHRVAVEGELAGPFDPVAEAAREDTELVDLVDAGSRT
jgi:glycosyltransferase involved in cell wall biosynthesis